MAAIKLHPVTEKPSVIWYEPDGKKRQKKLFLWSLEMVKGQNH